MKPEANQSTSSDGRCSQAQNADAASRFHAELQFDPIPSTKDSGLTAGKSANATTDSDTRITRPTTFTIDGVNAARGAYHGELQLLPGANGEIAVTRVATYDTFRYEGRHIQEVWTGVGNITGGKLNIDFRLKQADVFDKVDNQTRTQEQFCTPLSVHYSIKLSQDQTGQAGQKPAYQTIQKPPNKPGADGTITPIISSEKLTDERPSNAVPLWTDLRQAVPSQGKSFDAIAATSMASVFLPITYQYSHDKFVTQYAQRSEYRSGKQYFVTDPTDFDFLRAHPDFVRVDNKVTDSISLAEASSRADAYAHTLQEKATYFDRDMKESHLNELGLFAPMMLDKDGKQTGYGMNGDSALWSGMYAGSQAMRWLNTKDPEALANFKKVTKGLLLLMDVTGNNNEFARFAEPLKPGETLQEPWQQGAPPYEHIKYVKIGNNDMIKGIFQDFAWAFEILDDGDPLKEQVKEHAKKLTQLNVANEWNHRDNELSAYGLAALATGDREALHDYRRVYEYYVEQTDHLHLGEGLYYGGIADWSGINLTMVSQINDILIAKLLADKIPEDRHNVGIKTTDILTNFRQRLMETWSTYSTARRDFLTIAADAFAAHDTEALRFQPGTKPKSWSNEAVWSAEKEKSLWSLREVPLPVKPHAISFDYSMKPDWSVSAWPKQPWKYHFGKPISDFYQGAYQYPIFEGVAVTGSNYWTHAFEIKGESSLDHQNGRPDYLYTYWIGRLSGLIDVNS